MRIISAVVLVVALGCVKAPPEPQEKKMPENAQSQDAQAGPAINMLTLLAAVPLGEMPAFLQERNKATPPTVTLKEVRALEPGEREKVLAVVERALQYHLDAAQKHRNLGSASERTAENLKSFLTAARQ